MSENTCCQGILLGSREKGSEGIFEWLKNTEDMNSIYGGSFVYSVCRFFLLVFSNFSSFLNELSNMLLVKYLPLVCRSYLCEIIHLIEIPGTAHLPKKCLLIMQIRKVSETLGSYKNLCL